MFLTYACRAVAQIYNSHHHFLILISTACCALKFCSTVEVQEKKIKLLGNSRKDAQQFENDNQLKMFHSHYANDFLVSGATFNVRNLDFCIKKPNAAA